MEPKNPRDVIADAVSSVCSDGNADTNLVAKDVIGALSQAGFSIVYDPYRTVLKRYLGRVIAADHVIGLRAVHHGMADREVLIDLVHEIAKETDDPELLRWVGEIDSFS